MFLSLSELLKQGISNFKCVGSNKLKVASSEWFSIIEPGVVWMHSWKQFERLKWFMWDIFFFLI